MQMVIVELVSTIKGFKNEIKEDGLKKLKINVVHHLSLKAPI